MKLTALSVIFSLFIVGLYGEYWIDCYLLTFFAIEIFLHFILFVSFIHLLMKFCFSMTSIKILCFSDFCFAIHALFDFVWFVHLSWNSFFFCVAKSIIVEKIYFYSSIWNVNISCDWFSFASKRFLFSLWFTPKCSAT